MAIKEKETGFGKWKIIVAIIAIAIIAGAIGFATIMKDSKSVTISDDVKFTIDEGTGVSHVAQILYDSRVIKYPLLFKIESKIGGFDNQIQPGAITVKNGMSYNDILTLITNSERDSVSVVVPEGYEAKQIQKALADAGLACADDFMNALDPALYDYKFLKDIPERPVRLEGYLFPATYKIPKNFSAQEVVNLMLKTFDKMFTEEYYNKAAEMNMSVDQIVTMASIVERETDTDSERAKVAGVFYNRIKTGMKLQSCATVQYVLGERKPILSIADTKTDSPYNTYLYAGLPIGPIANPGEECIKAALYPEETDAFYFALASNGEHIFSKTYEEHVKAMENNNLIMSVDSSAVENEDAKK